MDITKSRINQWLNTEPVTEQLKIKVTERIDGKPKADMEKFIQNTEETFVLEVIAKPDGYGIIKEMLQVFAKDIGIDISGVSDAVYKSLIGNRYEDFQSLKEDFNKKKKEALKDTGTSGSGSGGGSGGLKVESSYDSKPKLEPIPPTQEQEIQKKGFIDVPDNHWAKAYIEKLYAKGVINGRTENTFCPEEPVSRGEFIKMMDAAFGIKAEELLTLPFDDVTENDWVYPYVQKAYSANVVQGISENMFGSEQPITRQDAAVIAVRILEHNGVLLADENSDMEFNDSDEIAEYAADAVNKLRKTGVLNGDENGYFLPNESTNRAAAAKIVCELMSDFN